MSFTTDDFVTSIKNRGLIPASQQTYEDTDMISLGWEELRTHITPLLISVRENFFMTNDEVDVVANQSDYEIPTRAVGMKLKKLFWRKNATSRPTHMTFVDVDKLSEIEVDYSGNPQYFYFKDTYFEIIPTQSTANGVLLPYYYKRRNKLVPTSSAGQITAIDTGTNTVTLNNVPTTFSLTKQYDFIKSTPGYRNYAEDQTPTGISGSDFTFASLPTGLSVGDWLCLAQESVIPQIPVEALDVLTQRTLIRILRGLGDEKGAEAAIRDLKEMKMDVLQLLSHRAENHAKKIHSARNIGQFFSGGSFGVWGE